MADFIVQATLSNLLVSTFLAIIAWIVQSRFQAASLANLLWILVLVKMVTPPLMSVPILEVQTVTEAPADPIPLLEQQPVDNFDLDLISLAAPSLSLPDEVAVPVADHHQPESLPETKSIGWLTWLGITWIATSAILFFITIMRIARFHLVLRKNIRPAPKHLHEIAGKVAKQIRLARVPEIVLTQANVSPFVWWIGGIPKVVVPELAVKSLCDEDTRMVLAHEMAHVKRHDHWIRWLEWFTLLLLWWNPIMWWARKQLRVTEEIACDALVVEKTQTAHHDYATSLLNMADYLTTSAIRPPAVASAMNSGGLLEKRLKMLIANKTFKVPLWIRAAICAAAIAVFPFGLVDAQDFDAIERRLERAVKAGELTIDEAESMLRALDKKSSAKQKGSDQKDLKKKYEAIADQMMQAVDAGKLTGEEAELKLHELQKKMFDKKKKKQRDDWQDQKADAQLAELKQKYEAIADEVMQAVDAGKLSGEEAELKLHELQKKMFDKKQKRDKKEKRDTANELDDLKQKYQTIANDLMREVDQGKLSAQEAELKLHELQKKMFDLKQQRDDWQDQEAADEFADAKRKYQAIANDLMRAVDREKISAEEAEIKLHELRNKMFEQESDRSDDRGEKKAKAELIQLQKMYDQVNDVYQREMDHLDKKKKPKTNPAMAELQAEYEAYVGEIKREVDRGNISAEEAERQLKKVRKDLFARVEKDSKKDRPSQETERELKMLKLHYADIVQALEDKVASGDMSADDAGLHYSELKKKLHAELNQQNDLGKAREKIERQILDLRHQIQASQDSLADAENRYKLLQQKLEQIEAADR